MLHLSAGSEASAAVAASPYEYRRPERTRLYQLVEDYYPALNAQLASRPGQRRKRVTWSCFQ